MLRRPFKDFSTPDPLGKLGIINYKIKKNHFHSTEEPRPSPNGNIHCEIDKMH